MPKTQPANDEHQVLRFPGGRKASPRPKQDDLAPYSGPPESDADYRDRMLVNGAVLLVVLALIGAALWLADTMATMRRNQDCVLSGRSGCTHVDVEPSRRW
jgi:hypothetical protein